ncbi:MAG: polymer-forming cytoskeletal protein [Actinomycetota bacterium]
MSRPNHRFARIAVLVLAIAAVSAIAAAPASAQVTPDQDLETDVGNDAQVVLNGDVRVESGDSVSGVVLFNGTAVIEGEVDGDVVVFNGDTEITGRVVGSVTVFSGLVTVGPGAEITGDLSTREAPIVDPTATIGGSTKRVSNVDVDFTYASRVVVWIATSLSLLLVGILLLAFAPRAMDALPRQLRERTGSSIAWGAGLFFLLPVVGVVALITLVGIPFGLGLLFALFAIYSVGYVATTHVVGRLILKEPRSRFLAFLIGWLLLRLIALVPFLAGLSWFLASAIGLGILASAARRADARGEALDSVPPPPAPASTPPLPPNPAG